MYKGWKKLTKKERKHLSEEKIRTTAQLQNTFGHQQDLRRTYPSTEPCWDCKQIARKLGYFNSK